MQAKVEWHRSTTPGVSGYRVTAHLANGTSSVVAQTGAGGDEIFPDVNPAYLSQQPRYSITTLTSYGWTAAVGEDGGALVLTALVVDDEPDARRRVAGLLRLGGWQVREAGDAEDALRQAAVTDFDLVVTDVSMPGENGPAMLRRMRRNGSRARFLVVTSDPTDDVRAESVTAGAMACLAKPVEARILLDFLRSRTTGLAAQGELPGRPRAGRPARRRPGRRAHGPAPGDVRRRPARPPPGDRAGTPLRATPRPSSRRRTPSPAPAASSGTRRSPRSAGPSPPTPAAGVMAHARVVELQELAFAV